MIIEELINELQKYPKDTVVKISDSGCTNCNPYGYEITKDVFRVEYYPSKTCFNEIHIT